MSIAANVCRGSAEMELPLEELEISTSKDDLAAERTAVKA